MSEEPVSSGEVFMEKRRQHVSKVSPSSRTLQLLRQLDGVECDKSEYRLPFNKGGFAKTKDLFGFIDLCVLVPGAAGVLGMQVTGSGSNAAHRLEKIQFECLTACLAWLRCGNRIEIWCWNKYKVKRGSAAVRWDARRIRVFLDAEGRLASEELPRASVLRKQWLESAQW